MAKAYTKSDVIEAALLRFRLAKVDTTKLEVMFSDFYDEKGKDTFRKYASVDADCMKIWKEYNELN